MKLITILLLFLITNSYSQENTINGTIKVKKNSEREIVVDSVETIYMNYAVGKKYKYYIKASFPGVKKS